MRRKKTYTTVAVVVILLLALFGGYKYFSGSDKEKNAASAEITEVKRMQIKSVVSATGTIRPVTDDAETVPSGSKTGFVR